VEGWIVQACRALDADQFHDVARAQHAGGLEDVVRIVEPKFGRQHSPTHRVHASLDLEAHDGRDASIA